MIGHVNKDSFKSDQSIMLENLEARGGCSSRNSGTINSYPSILPVPTPELKYTKREFSGLTIEEMYRSFEGDIPEVVNDDAVDALSTMLKFNDFFIPPQINIEPDKNKTQYNYFPGVLRDFF